MTIDQMKRIFAQMGFDIDPKQEHIYLFYLNNEGVVSNLSISVRRAKHRNGKRMSDEDILQMMEEYPLAKESKPLFIEKPDEEVVHWEDTTDVCQRLKISRHTLQRWVKIGLLHPAVMGRKHYFNRKEVDALLKSNIIQENGRLDTSEMDGIL